MPRRHPLRLLAALAVALPLVAAVALAEEPATGAAPPLPAEPDGFALPADPAPGRALFVQHCALCHGDAGEGDGQLSPHLRPPPGNLPERVGERSDWELYLLIRDGGQAIGRSPVMVGFGERLSDEELLAVTAFARSLGEEEE
jgi:mono/diheme cytochrome c family protein